MCQGEDPDGLHPVVAPPKSIGHGKVMPPGTRELEVILTYLLHMSEKVGARLRRHQMVAQRFLVGWKCEHGWAGDKLRLPVPGDDGNAIFRLARFALESHWHGEPVNQIQVTALDPRPAHQQLELFAESDRHEAGNRVMDEVNQRYGSFTLAPARLLQRSAMPDVIAPAWKPSGHRKTV
jgi:DNA polymerase-4